MNDKTQDESAHGRGDAPPRRRAPPQSAPGHKGAPAQKSAPAGPVKEDFRIAKVMARAGHCSRREAEAWIAQGRVSVNGVVLTSPAFNVGPRDKVVVDGRPLGARERTRLFLFNKPRGLVTTNADPEGRPTIFTALPPELPRLVAVGRLDINSEGLLLLTNDGGLARILELPKTGWLRRYRVRANGSTDQARLDALRGGLTIDGEDYAGIEAVLDRVQGANVWLTMGLREGKNREIKRVLEHIGLYVNRLIRISYGPFQLGEIGEGAVDEVPGRVLRDQLGETLSAEAGVDFEAPVINPLMTPQERDAFMAERQQTLRRDDDARRKAGTRHGSAAREDETRVERLKPSPRRHVSALRAKDGANDGAKEGAGRKRIERGATADRKGRTVPVERLSAVGPDKADAKSSRNGRRFAEEQRRTMRQDAATFGERRVRPPKEEPDTGFKPRKRFDRRNAEGERFAERREKPGGAGRSEGPRGERRGDGPPGRKPFGARPPSEKRFEKGARGGDGGGDKKRFSGDRPERGRSEGRSFDKKPFGGKPRGADAGARGGARAPSPGGRGPRKPDGGRSGGGKPGGGKPAFRKGPR